MSKTLYEDIIFPLPQNIKMKARIEGLRFEKTLYQLNIEYMNKRIADQQKCIDDFNKSVETLVETGQDISVLEGGDEPFILNIKEFEVKIMDYQTKMKMCDIRICREEHYLKNYKEF